VFERFTDRARRVLVLAQEEARQLHHNFIGTEHILLGLVAEGHGVAARALLALDVSGDDVRAQVEEIVGRAAAPITGSPPFTPRAKKVLELSLREALQLGHNYIGTEHILLGLVREGEGVASQVLSSLGVDLGRLRHEVVLLLAGASGTSETSGAGTEAAGPEPATPECSFCGRRAPEAGTLLAGRHGAHVCEHCVGHLSERLAAERRSSEPPSDDH
jgi:ATP-dependent Clp protease ATP-binding subunit ClpC